MVQKILCFLWIGLVGVMGIKAQNDQLKDIDAKIDHYIQRRPDSAIFYLKRSLKYRNRMTDSLLGNIYGKLGESYGRISKIDSARGYFTKAIKTVENYPGMVGDLYIELGKTERNKGDYDKAFEALKRAEMINDNAVIRARVLLEKGTIYNYISNEGEAIKTLKKAIRISDSVSADHYLFISKQELANAYNNTGEYDFALKLYEDILPELEEKTSRYNYYIVLFGYAKCHLELKNLKEAKKIYTQIISYFDEVSNVKLYSYGLYKLAQVYEQLEQFEPALSNYDKAFRGMATIKSARLKQVATDYLNFLLRNNREKQAWAIVNKIEDISPNNRLALNGRVEVNYLLETIKVLKKNRLYENALVNLEKVAHLKDSIGKKRNEVKIREVQEAYRNKYLSQRNRILTQNLQSIQDKNEYKKNWLITGTTLFILVVMGGLLIYRKQKHILVLKTADLEKSKKIKDDLTEKLSLETKLFEEREEKLKEKQRELVATTLKLYNIEHKTRSFIKNSKKENMSAIQMRQKLRLIFKQEKNWEFFISKFVEVHPVFNDKLKQRYHKLTLKDLDFASLIKLGLSNKEIGVILNISHRSVITKKYRLRKKMEFSDEKLSLEEHIQSI